MDQNRQSDVPADSEEQGVDSDAETNCDDVTNEISSDDGEESTKEFDPGGRRRMSIMDSNDLIGQIYITLSPKDRQRLRLRIIEFFDQNEQGRLQDPLSTRFKATNGRESHEETVLYNQSLNQLGDGHCKRTNGHQGPLLPLGERYKGPQWNVRAEWENGKFSGPVSVVIKKVQPATSSRQDGQYL